MNMKEQSVLSDLTFKDAVDNLHQASITEVGRILGEGRQGKFVEYPVQIPAASAGVLRRRLHNGFLEQYRLIDQDSQGNNPIAQQVLHEDSSYQQIDMKLETVMLDRTSRTVDIYLNEREVDDLSHVIAVEHELELAEMGESDPLKRTQLLEEVGVIYEVINKFEAARGIPFETVYRDHFQDEVAILANESMTLNDFLQGLHD